MDSNVSLADIAAVTKDHDGFLGGSGGLWVLIILLFLMGGNGFGYGNRDTIDVAPATMEQQFLTQRDVLTSGCSTQKEVLESRYDNALAMNNLESKIAECCCSIKEAISSDGMATRQLITDNLINDLREKLNSANNAIVNGQQTESILNQLGRFVPYTVTAFSGYNTYPYGTYPYGYTYGYGNGTVI